MSERDVPRSKATASEEELLHLAPNVAKDCDQVRRESDEGPTSETMLIAYEILEGESYGVELAELEAANRESELRGDGSR